MYSVRRIRADEGAVYRDIRLAALLDNPSAFGSTYAAEVGRTRDDWDANARGRSSGNTDGVFFAVDHADSPVGLVGVYLGQDQADTAQLVSMWVRPAHRRKGAAQNLIKAVAGLARNANCVAVELWVTTGNDPALGLYAAAGFAETGEFQPLPSDPCVDEIRMRLDLRPHL